MKKIYQLLALITLLVSGCTQDEVVKNQDSSSKSLIYTASFEGSESRTYLNEDGYLRWTANDQISIFGANTYNQQYKFTGETGANSGTFEKVSGSYATGTDLNHHYALYPYSSQTTISETGVITPTIPANQTYAVNSFGLGDNTMVAVTADKNDTFLKFKNVGGYLELKLYGDNVTVKSIKLEGNSDEKLAGNATITSIYGQDPTISMANDATKSITMDCGDSGVKLGTTAETATTFLLVVPPTTFASGFTITVTDINGGEFTKSTSKSIEIKRNIIQPMNAFEVETVSTTIPNNQIWYTSSNSNSISPYTTNVFGANIVSNEYKNGKGIITFDGDVTMIGNYAFYLSRSLISISIPNSVTKIGKGAFQTCTSLTNITFSNNVSTIGESAFESCNSLTNIIIPNSVTTIEDKTFYSCYKLDNISIPNGVTKIGKQAFSGCQTLTSITIPNSVTTIGEKAFTYCRSLANIIVNDENSFYDSRENCNAIINTASNTLISGCKNTVIPNSVSIIGKGAFQACYDMVDITIPNSVTTIGEDAFDNCSSLTDITIPNSVTTIEDRAFFLCSSLSRVDVKAITPPTTGVYIFQSCSSNIEFYVPAESLEAYKAADYWKDLNILSASEDWFNPNQYIT